MNAKRMSNLRKLVSLVAPLSTPTYSQNIRIESHSYECVSLYDNYINYITATLYFQQS